MSLISDVKTILFKMSAIHRDAGSIPYLIPVGGSTTVGTWGYIEAFRELMDQVQDEKTHNN